MLPPIKIGYASFLAGTTALSVASEKMPDAESFRQFVLTVLRRPHFTDGHLTDPLEEKLAWFLFEEIGWPEGVTYCFDGLQSLSEGVSEHYLKMLRRSKPQIDGRLENRRSRWRRPSKEGFLTAHALLLQLIDRYIENQPTT